MPCGQHSSSKRLQQLDHPTLLLSGNRSPTVAQLVVSELARQISSATHVQLEALGHMATPCASLDRRAGGDICVSSRKGVGKVERVVWVEAYRAR